MVLPLHSLGFKEIHLWTVWFQGWVCWIDKKHVDIVHKKSRSQCTLCPWGGYNKKHNRNVHIQKVTERWHGSVTSVKKNTQVKIILKCTRTGLISASNILVQTVSTGQLELQLWKSTLKSLNKFHLHFWWSRCFIFTNFLPILGLFSPPKEVGKKCLSLVDSCGEAN